MSVEAQKLLAADCEEFARLSVQAQAWVEDRENSDLIGAEARSLTQMMRRSARRANRLARAAKNPMSVSVFGPSQAGKSFLVSVLARPENGSLVADFGGADAQLDYIRQINPEGEGESTGLVTRFTMARSETPDGFPVKLVLLSEADIVRILINSFFMDGDRSEPVPDAAEIAAHLDRFRARKSAERPGFDADDMFDVADYVEAAFGRESYASALKPLWEEASDIVPCLSLSDRADFWAVLWGGHTAFSDLYETLAGALSQLGNGEYAHVGLTALTPRETSIIDVKTLSGSADDTPLTVRSATGAQVELPRSVV